MKIIFADVDGVLNDHWKHPNQYSPLCSGCVEMFTILLDSVPKDTGIVLSSAWRYMVAGGAMSLRGFEYLLMLAGGPWDTYNERIVGITESDEETCYRLGLAERGAKIDHVFLKENGLEIRAEQIRLYARENKVDSFVVLDDLNIPVENLVQTLGDKGLGFDDVCRAIATLEGRRG